MTVHTAPVARRLWCAAAGVLLGVTTALVGAAPAHAKTARDLEWWLSALHVEEIQQQQTDGSGVIVAVVDSPVDGNHPDLAGHVLPGLSADGTGNGWGTGQSARHGTEMAGIIAGGGKPGGYLGIAPGAKILPVNNGGDARGTGAAIRWAVDHGAKVVNLSVGGPDPTTPEELAAVRYAEDHDVVLVGAAGNIPEDNDSSIVITPARIPGVIAVGALDQQAGAWYGSSRGPEVALTAPGVDIIAPAPLNTSPSGYGSVTGTSPATAFVSGVAALIRAKYPGLNAPSVIERLIRTAKDLGPPGRDEQYGYGVMRPLLALTDPVPAVSANPLGTAGGPAASVSTTTTAISSGSSGSTRSEALAWLLPVGGGLLLVIVVVVIVAVTRRRRTPPTPPGWPPPPPGPPHVHSGHTGPPPPRG
jgi:subtilisin family serine protease